MARLLGSVAYLAAPRLRRNAIDNLTHAFGAERSPAEIRTIARRSFQSLGMTAVEWLIIGRWSRERLTRAFPDALAVTRRLRDDVHGRGSGGIGLTAHCGNWEVLSYLFAVAAPGFLVPVANRVYYEKYQDFVHRQRTVFGTQVIYTDESPRRMVRAVHEGNLPSYLPDQEVRTNSGVFVDFFGRPAYTSPFPVQLARKLGVPMVLAILFREGSTFRAYYSGLIDVPRTEDEAADILAGTQAWTRILEEQIRRDPAQWAWLHPRWRATPDRPRTKLRGRGRRASRPAEARPPEGRPREDRG